MPETSPPIGEAQTEPAAAQCPMLIKPPVEGGSNRDSSAGHGDKLYVNSKPRTSPSRRPGRIGFEAWM